MWSAGMPAFLMSGGNEMLKELYTGELKPVDRLGISEEYMSCREQAFLLEQQLRELLNNEQQEILDEVLEAQMLMVSAALQEGYLLGFREGAQMQIEILADNT